MNKNVYVSLVKWAQEISADENTNIAGFFLAVENWAESELKIGTFFRVRKFIKLLNKQLNGKAEIQCGILHMFRFYKKSL